MAEVTLERKVAVLCQNVLLFCMSSGIRCTVLGASEEMWSSAERYHAVQVSCGAFSLLWSASLALTLDPGVSMISAALCVGMCWLKHPF